MLEQSIGRTLKDQVIAGYAALVDDLPQSLSEDMAALELQEASLESGLPTPAVRGLADPFRWLLRQFRGRQFVADLGRGRVSVPWLTLHSPPGGDCALSWSASNKTDMTCSVTVFGTGGGRGRTVQWSVENEIGARSDCLDLLQEFEVELKAYQSGAGYEYLETSVVAASSRRLATRSGCHLCGIASNDLDMLEVELEPGIDLRDFDQVLREKRRLNLTDSSSLSVGVDTAAQLATTLASAARRERNFACEVNYSLAPGRWYQPYVLYDERLELPAWALA